MVFSDNDTRSPTSNDNQECVSDEASACHRVVAVKLVTSLEVDWDLGAAVRSLDCGCHCCRTEHSFIPHPATVAPEKDALQFCNGPKRIFCVSVVADLAALLKIPFDLSHIGL